MDDAVKKVNENVDDGGTSSKRLREIISSIPELKFLLISLNERGTTAFRRSLLSTVHT